MELGISRYYENAKMSQTDTWTQKTDGQRENSISNRKVCGDKNESVSRKRYELTCMPIQDSDQPSGGGGTFLYTWYSPNGPHFSALSDI